MECNAFGGKYGSLSSKAGNVYQVVDGWSLLRTIHDLIETKRQLTVDGFSDGTEQSKTSMMLLCG